MHRPKLYLEMVGNGCFLDLFYYFWWEWSETYLVVFRDYSWFSAHPLWCLGGRGTTSSAGDFN